MTHTCPNHELSRESIMQIFYAQLSHDDQTLRDACAVGSYMQETIKFRWNLLEKIKRNSEDWELDRGKTSGIKFKFDCVKSFVKNYLFHEFSNECGLDPEIALTFCETFANYVDLPKEKWFKFHPPTETLQVELVEKKKEEIVITHVDLVAPQLARNSVRYMEFGAKQVFA